MNATSTPIEIRSMVAAIRNNDDYYLPEELVALALERYASTLESEERLASARESASCTMSGIAEMVAALECDYDRLEELKESIYGKLYVWVDDHSDNASDDPRECIAWLDEFEKEGRRGYVVNEENERIDLVELRELAELIEAAGECENRDDAEQRIQEDPLSIELRSEWYTPGQEDDAQAAAEFQILLTTGGPAVRIMGELNVRGEPDRAWLEFQDWGTAWTEYHGENADQDTLLKYCSQFSFGE